MARVISSDHLNKYVLFCVNRMQILRELFGPHFGQQIAGFVKRETERGSDFIWNRCTVWKTWHSSLELAVCVCLFML